jgi:hypothetical protein
MILNLVNSLVLIEIDSIVLDRASPPMPLGALGLAAPAHGFKVMGT